MEGQFMKRLNCAIILVVVALSAADSFARDEPVEITAEQAQQNLLNYSAIQPDPQLKISGVVKLRVVVGTDGKVASITVVSGDLRLAERAGQAIKQWEYKPFLQDGKPAAVAFQLEIPLLAPQVVDSGKKEKYLAPRGKKYYEESGIHACMPGYAMSGALADQDVLLCRRLATDASAEETKSDDDPGTRRNDMHACPIGWYMRGFKGISSGLFQNAYAKNALLCSRDPNVRLSNEVKESHWEDVSSLCSLKDLFCDPLSSEDPKVSRKRDELGHYMWVCPEERPVLTGIHVSASRHLFLCARIGE
jgi:TonB family protein